MSPSIAIEARNVILKMGGSEILKGASLNAGPGLTALIGPNGAGKTTLLRVLSGFLTPTAGEALLVGKPIQTYTARARARLISVVAQSDRMEYEFTALDVVLMGRTPWKKSFEPDTPDDIQIARDALARTGALQFENRLITRLSGGEQQRVLIARALCQTTPILLLDEPVSALDLRHQTSILQTVRDAVDEKGLACVCVLHDLNLAAHYADRVALMQDGRVQHTGSPREVLTRDILESVYNTEVRVFEDEEELYILPRMRRRSAKGGA